MRKGFKRLLVFVMVIATVCLLSTSVVADDAFKYTSKLYNNSVTITERGTITARETSGSITVNNSYNSYTNYATIEVTYRFYSNDYSQPALTRTKNNGSLTGSAHVSSTASDDIYIMIDATYTVYAEFDTSGGRGPYGPYTHTIQPVLQ